MTALGLLYPGHAAEDDYPRMEQLLGSDIRVDLVHTETGEDTHHVDALRELGTPEHLAAGVERLRLSGAEAVVLASTSASFVHGWDGARDQVRNLARAAGLPASATSFGFVRAVQEVGAHRVAVAATYPEDVAALFAEFLGAAGVEVVAVRGAGVGTAAEVARWGAEDVLRLARESDHPQAQAVLLPNTALHTVACVRELEEALGKPVLTANQVTVWEGLRLADRRVNAPRLGALFTREPIVQV
jgi:maleate cis-trans isomerase